MNLLAINVDMNNKTIYDGLIEWQRRQNDLISSHQTLTASVATKDLEMMNLQSSTNQEIQRLSQAAYDKQYVIDNL